MQQVIVPQQSERGEIMFNFDEAIKNALTIFLIIGIGIGFILFVGLPWLWALLKPFIHMVTA